MDLSKDPGVIKVIADLTALGTVSVGDALTFAKNLAAHIEGAAPMLSVDVSEAALALFYDALPTPIRPIVETILGNLSTQTIQNLDDKAVGLVKTYVGAAISRLQSWLAPAPKAA